MTLENLLNNRGSSKIVPICSVSFGGFVYFDPSVSVWLRAVFVVEDKRTQRSRLRKLSLATDSLEAVLLRSHEESLEASEMPRVSAG